MTDKDPPDHPGNQPKWNDQAEYLSAVTEQLGSALKQLADDFSALKRDLSSQLSALYDQIQATAEKQADARNRYERKQLYWTTAVAVLTFLVLLGTCNVVREQKNITGGQLDVMGKQLIEMQTASKDTSTVADAAKTQAANTKILAETAQLQAKAAIETAQAATKNIEITQQNIILDQRAWVGPVAARIVTLKENSLAKFTIEFRNSGKTPALKLETNVGVAAYLSSDKFVPRYDVRSSSTQNSISVIQPTEVFESSPESGAVVSGRILADIKTGRVAYYVFGRITYEDIFQQKRFTHFCFYIKPDLTGLSSCNTYNDAN